MTYYTLLRGRSKTRLEPVMIDELKKVENRKAELQGSDPSTGKTWHYEIRPAGTQAKPWRKRANGQWKNRDSANPPLVRNGSRS